MSLAACQPTSTVYATDELAIICDYTQWEGCWDVPPPVIVESDIIRAVCLPCLGLTPRDTAENYIFIRKGMDAKTREEAITHETVHHVIKNLGLTQDHCEHESMARALTALILNTEYDHTWKIRYGCTKSA
jgi:hypothetical protein